MFIGTENALARKAVAVVNSINATVKEFQNPMPNQWQINNIWYNQYIGNIEVHNLGEK